MKTIRVTYGVFWFVVLVYSAFLAIRELGPALRDLMLFQVSGVGGWWIWLVLWAICGWVTGLRMMCAGFPFWKVEL